MLQIPIDKIKISISEKKKLNELLRTGYLEFEYSPLSNTAEPDEKTHYLEERKKFKYDLTQTDKERITKFINNKKHIDNNETYYNKGFNYSYKPISIISVINNKNYDIDIDAYGFGEGVPEDKYKKFVAEHIESDKIPEVTLEKHDKYYYIGDGHNRVIGSIIKGSEYINATVKNINKSHLFHANSNSNLSSNVNNNKSTSTSTSKPRTVKTAKRKTNKSGSSGSSGSSGRRNTRGPNTKKAKKIKKA